MTREDLKDLSDEELRELRRQVISTPGLISQCSYEEYQAFLTALFEDPEDFFSKD